MQERYRRQTSIPGWGEEGQEKLARSRVMVVGAGGLGFPVISYLAAAGVGELTVFENDVVEETNLNRQLFFSDRDLGRPKLEVVAERLQAINRHVRLRPVAARFSEEAAEAYLAQVDAVVDCVDNFTTRFTIASLAHRYQKPMIHGGIAGFLGVTALFDSRYGPCFACLYPDVPPLPAPAVFGAQAGLVGSLQVVTTLKYLLGIGEPSYGKMLLIDTETGFFHTVDIAKNERCPICGAKTTNPPA